MLPDKFRLQIPGPTPIPPRVQQAMNQPMIGHRDPDCSNMVAQLSQRLGPLFGTKEPVLLFASSGTAALEAAVVNTLAPGDEAAVIVSGAFGDRFSKILSRYDITLHQMDVPWGEACQPEQLARFLQKHAQVKAVFLTYCETSTGVLHPIGELAAVIHRETNALVIVDGVSCIGGVESHFDEWGLDILVTGSQKALMLPPGLSFAAVSPRAWQIIEKNPRPRFYLDFQTYRTNIAKETTPFTPAVSLLFGLAEVLAMIEEEGFQQVVERHQLMMRMTRAGIRAMGLTLMTTDTHASPTVTSVMGDDNGSADALRKELRRLSFRVAGGQQHLKGKIFRIGHMGYCDPIDVLTTIATIEVAAKRLELPVQLGAGIQAAEEELIYVSHTRN
ncbi:pyridoxal-phosphate-dependent aminotransferase family protein [Marininema halotolerans]|uniref:Aspartate aminotransferase n=1 Tax=Marininema halotolerans TaxID=1155944 RepID=A0A1I6TRX2_9BACL|nr:alanine--glyoxylate aminotransferase family protein [Marininema halotolerans]SFS91737.1 aspartate aminotransferase [Marininema halotolerans]